MQSEPVTWSKRDRVTYYRLDAARFESVAEAQSRSEVRDQLVALARQYRELASTLETRVLAA
jgi:hypothetical protein